MNHTKQHCESNITQSVEPIETETVEKGASTRQAKKRGGEGAVITHQACWLERERVVAHQEEHQGQTAQV